MALAAKLKISHLNMNPEYAKLEERRFSQDFTTEFTNFIEGNKNIAFFDKTWSSKEHRQKFSRLLAQYPLNFHEFESSTLSLEVLKAKIVGFTAAQPADQSDFKLLCDTMESAGLVMVYRCSELSSDSVELLSKLNAFLKGSDSQWKIAYFGEKSGVSRRHRKLLAPEMVYTSPSFASRLTKLLLDRKILLLTLLCLLTVIYFWQDIQRHQQDWIAANRARTLNLPLPSLGTDDTQIWLDQDIRAWESRVAEFDQAMEGYVTPVSPQGPDGIPPDLTITMSDELNLAAKTGDIQLIESRISSGFSIDAATSNRETLLILASLNGQRDLVSWLLDHGADVHLVDSDNGSALYYAAVNGHFEIASALLKHDASTTQVSKLNKTPLMAAVHNDYLGLSSLLIDANSDVNQQDHSGWSALFYAIWNGNFEMTELLLKSGADPGLKDNDGYTPTDIAKARKRAKILTLL